MTTTRQAESFIALAIAQGLIRNKYKVSPDERLNSGLRADLLARKGPETIIVELKAVSDRSEVQAAVEGARRHLARSGEFPGFVAVGVKGTEEIYLDEALSDRLRYTSEDFHANLI